VTFRMT